MDDVQCEGSFGPNRAWDISCAGVVTLTVFDHRYPTHDHATLCFGEACTPMARIGGRPDGRSGALLVYSGGYDRHWLGPGQARSRQSYINPSLVRDCGAQVGRRAPVA